MISPFPRSRLICFRGYLYPFFTFPIKYADRIVPNLIGSSPSKQNDSMILLIVIHRAVWPMRRYVSSGLDFLPFHGYCIEAPKIVHVVRIYIYYVMYLHILQRRLLRPRWCSNCVPNVREEDCCFDCCVWLVSSLFFPLIESFRIL